MKITICAAGFKRMRDALQAALPRDEIAECAPADAALAAADSDVLIPIMAPITAAVFQSQRLRLVQQYGVGLEAIDIDAATRAGIPVANVPSGGSGNAESVAELAIAQMMMLGRDLPQAQANFYQRRFGAPIGRALWQSCVVIVGYGGIGQEIARRLAGWGVRIVAVSRRGPGAGPAQDGSVHVDRHVDARGLRAALAEADYVVVAAPASAANVGLIGREAIAAMKPGAFIVNIARGAVIDYDALLEGLRSGRIAGAALDVFWQEPFDPDDPLLRERVIPTPHIAGVTEECFRGVGQAVAANIERLRAGEQLANCANPEVLS